MARLYGHKPYFAGCQVLDWQEDSEAPNNPAKTAIAIRSDWEDAAGAWQSRFNDFMSRSFAREIPALVIGMWGEHNTTIDPIVELVAANRDNLPALRALFVGDITSEENEISWIQQGDLSPLLNAYPNLQTLKIRGGSGLRLGSNINMPALKFLKIETGGMDGAVARDIGAGNFPALEKLILWLGTANYGATTTIDDLKPFYECKNMPNLRYLALCNSDIQDEIAAFIAAAPVVERLHTLDLSMGILTDEGALALLTSPHIRKLKKLDLHHHFCTDDMMAKLRNLRADGVSVDVSEQEDDDEWRFVAVGE